MLAVGAVCLFVSPLRRFVASSLCHWVIGLLDRCVIGLSGQGYWAARLLGQGYWVIGLLGYWIIGSLCRRVAGWLAGLLAC